MGHQIDTIRACELDAGAIDDWQELRTLADGLDSSFHDPRWFVAVSHFWPTSRVTLVRDGATLVGALPHDSTDGRTLRPPAHHLADHQGGAFHPSTDVDVRTVLRRVGAERYVFDHASDGQQWLDTSIVSWVPSPTIDLAGGFEHYLATRTSAGSGLAAWERRRRSIIERRFGPISFEPASDDHDDLDQLVRWKSDQYLRSGHPDLFADPKVRSLVEHLTFGDAQIDVRLSVLRGGDHTLAVHLGPRSPSSWHWWLPAYDPQFASISAGTVLLLELARHGAGEGVERIDLGKGDEPYKQRLADSHLRIGVGVVERRPWVASVRRQAKSARAAARTRVIGRRQH